MSADRVITTILKAAGGVASLVSDRITPVRRDPGGSLPAIVYHQISGIPDHNLGGAVGYETFRFQIDCWAATSLEATDLAQAVQTALDGVSGSYASETVDHIFVEDFGDLPVLSAGNAEMEQYGKRMDVRMVLTT